MLDVKLDVTLYVKLDVKLDVILDVKLDENLGVMLDIMLDVKLDVILDVKLDIMLDVLLDVKLDVMLDVLLDVKLDVMLDVLLDVKLDIMLDVLLDVKLDIMLGVLLEVKLYIILDVILDDDDVCHVICYVWIYNNILVPGFVKYLIRFTNVKLMKIIQCVQYIYKVPCLAVGLQRKRTSEQFLKRGRARVAVRTRVRIPLMPFGSYGNYIHPTLPQFTRLYK